MRIETIKTWILVGFGLLMIGMLLYIFQIPKVTKLARLLGVLGVIYFSIGVALSVMHDRHMIERTRAGQE